MISIEALANGLRRATLLFLTVPLLIFFAGWLRWPWAVAVCASLVAALWPSRDPSRDRSRFSGGHVSVWALLLLVILPAAVLTGLSGAGGWGSGDSDWLKHDTILRDLLTRSWPVTYATRSGPILLVYYVTYYLPAALVGKLAGGNWSAASQALALTTFLGIALAAGWMVALAAPTVASSDPGKGNRGRSSWRIVALAAGVFLGFSGLDVIGKVAVNLYLGLPAFYGDWNDIEWWAQFAQYSSNAATVFWAPQHAFGGWLPAALAVDDWFRGEKLERRGALYLALALAWSPFAAVGLAPLIVGMIAGQPRGVLRPGCWWWQWASVENAAGLLAGGMFALYLAAHFQNYPVPALYRVIPGFHPMPLLARAPRLALYAVFVGLEFGGFSLALAIFFRRGRLRRGPANARDAAGASSSEVETDPVRAERWLLWLATAVLLVLPCFRYGYANDLVMRGGIPALFVLQTLIARMFACGRGRPSRAQWFAVGLTALLLIAGWGNTFLEYRRHVVRMIAQRSWRDQRTREPVRSLAELHRTIYARPGFDFARQYLGSVDSPFVRYAAARRGALEKNEDAPERPSDF